MRGCSDVLKGFRRVSPLDQARGQRGHGSPGYPHNLSSPKSSLPTQEWPDTELIGPRRGDKTSFQAETTTQVPLGDIMPGNYHSNRTKRHFTTKSQKEPGLGHQHTMVCKEKQKRDRKLEIQAAQGVYWSRNTAWEWTTNSLSKKLFNIVYLKTTLVGKITYSTIWGIYLTID